MNYLSEIAGRIKDAVPPAVRPEAPADELFRIYACLALALGTGVKASDIHNAWAAWMAGKDPNHPALVPFRDLDPETQSEDEPFLLAVRKVAASLQL